MYYDDGDGDGNDNSNGDNGAANGDGNGDDHSNDGDNGVGDGDVNFNHFSGIDELNQRFLKSKDFQKFLLSNDPGLYDKLVNNQADQDNINEALEKWKQESDGNTEEDEKKEGGGKDTEPEAKGGETVGKVDMHALYLSKYYYPCYYACVLYNHVFIPELAWRAVSLSLSLSLFPCLCVCVLVLGILE